MPRSARSLLLGSTTTGPVGDIGLLLLRVFAGLALALAHGLGKLPPSEGFINRVGGFGFPAPVLFAWLSGLTETIGGTLLAAGLLTRPVAAAIVFNMTTAVVFGHAGDPFGRRELPLLFGFVALLYAFNGAGRYSIDALLQRPTPARR